MWLKEFFGTHKPVIGMAHLPALPGTPRHDTTGGVNGLVEHVIADVDKLVAGGIDAIMFCNEDDRPYVLKAGLAEITAMTRIVTEAAPKGIPFGVDFLWDPKAAIAIAHATGASFVREVFTGMYESDMGLWAPKAGEVMRFRSQIGADHIRVLYNIVPEFASPLGGRDIALRARSVAVSCLPDGILVSGMMAGEEPDISVFDEIKSKVQDIPIFLNTGATAENIEDFLRVADGVIVGSSLKVDGHTWNKVDVNRVRQFMDAVHTARDKYMRV
jgi:membrane complex biogenesis BtpA family protein